VFICGPETRTLIDEVLDSNCPLKRSERMRLRRKLTLLPDEAAILSLNELKTRLTNLKSAMDSILKR